jgi:hypothetical protein
MVSELVICANERRFDLAVADFFEFLGIQKNFITIVSNHNLLVQLNPI